VHIYTQDGNYTVALTVSNNISSNTTIAASFINVSSENTLITGFSSSVTSGDAPLKVQFNDTSSGSPTAWLWDFGDGNNSTSQNPTYTYTEPGTYSVSLQASTASGQSVLTMPDYITVNDDSDSSSDSSSSSSSSSGSLVTSVGSPEPASNVEVTLQAQRCVAAGNYIKFEFTKGATCIDHVEFDAKKTLGKITTTIEQLLDISVQWPCNTGKYLKCFNWVHNQQSQYHRLFFICNHIRRNK
jgi:PKD repeat protein